MNRERFRDLCAEYLLSGLHGEELAEFERELERAGEAGRRELERMREVLGSVALSADPAAPPPELEARVLARIRRTRAGGDSPEIVASPPVEPESPGARWGWIAAAALLALVAGGLAAWNVRLQGDLTATRASLEAARQRIAVLDSVDEALGRLEHDLLALASPQGRTVSLAGTDARPEARARVFVDPVTGRALLFAYELPILPPDSVYQLWAIRGERPVSVGVFTASDEGPARLEVEDPALLEGADALAVTVEPAPGRPAPTGEMVLIGSS